MNYKRVMKKIMLERQQIKPGISYYEIKQQALTAMQEEYIRDFDGSSD